MTDEQTDDELLADPGEDEYRPGPCSRLSEDSLAALCEGWTGAECLRFSFAVRVPAPAPASAGRSESSNRGATTDPRAFCALLRSGPGGELGGELELGSDETGSASWAADEPSLELEADVLAREEQGKACSARRDGTTGVERGGDGREVE